MPGRNRSSRECEFASLFGGLFGFRCVGFDRGQRRLAGGLRGEDQPRSENDETEREIGRKGLDGEEKERRDERQAQIQRVEAEILAHGLADTEEGVAAAEEVGGFTVHFRSEEHTSELQSLMRIS